MRPVAVTRYSREWVVLFLAIGCVAARTSGRAADVVPGGGGQTAEPPFRGVLISADAVTPKELDRMQRERYTAIALPLSSKGREREAEAARRIREAGLELYYWIEVGRSPELADAHPEWMVSVQGHAEWRRLFPRLRETRKGEVVKAYPWVSILYEEVYEAQLQRIAGLLDGRTKAEGVFLNDLQGGPSACGCGHPLCRWTTDYGPIRTATPSGADAAARFLSAVRRLAPDADVVPVWATECEKHDGAADGACAGVGCFDGACWRESTRQLAALEPEVRWLGALAIYKELKRDLPIYPRRAGWILRVAESFVAMPPRYGRKAIQPGRLILVLQGWDVAREEVDAQLRRARESGARGYLLSKMRIDQSWRPVIYSVPGK